MSHEATSTGWPWADEPAPQERADDPLVLAAARCFASVEGALILAHLEHVFLHRRVAPERSDAELRHIEGQRSVVAYLLRLARQ